MIVQNISPESVSQADTYKELITSALEINLRQAGFLLLPYEENLKKVKSAAITKEDLQNSSAVIKLGQQLGANLAFIGLFRISGNSLHIILKCYSIDQNRLLSGIMRKSIVGLAAHNLINKSINTLVNELVINPALFDINRPNVAAKSEKEAAADALVSISLLSEDEEAEVFINNEDSAGKISNGCLNLYTLSDAELLVVIKKKGYHPRQALLTIEATQRSYTLPRLIKETRWATELYLSAGLFPGLGIAQRFYLIPDAFYLSLEDYFFLREDKVKVFEQNIFNDVRLLAGSYLFARPEHVVRVGVAAGFGVLLTSVDPGLPLYTDYYLNVLNLALETHLKQWVFWLRIEFKYALGLGTNILGKRWFAGEQGVPPLSLGVSKKW